MQPFIKEEEEYIKSKLVELGYEIKEVVLNVSSRPELGDYQFNGIMGLGKEYHKNPREIGQELVDLIKKDNKYKDINMAGPGFINISFSDEKLIKHANELNDNISINYQIDNPRTIFLDYGGANVAKALHVGHLRSANIGEALKRLAASLGNYKGEYPKESPVTNEDLMRMYPIASSKAKEDEEYMNEAREITAKFQSGDRGLIALWNHIMAVSKKDIKESYDRLNTTFEVWEGESDADKYVPEMIEYLEKKRLVEDSQGARIIEVKEENDDHEVPPLLLVKSNGALSYETTDLACIWERMHKWKPDEIWYLTDSRQALHFEIVFRAAKKAQIVNEDTNLEFIPFGTMNGIDGKPFKTRDGGTMKLDDLLDLATKECEKRILPNISGKERENIANKVGISAVKYADLLPFRLTDYIFDPVKFSDLQGKTGPYLLYSTIRMKSLLSKANEENIAYKKVKVISDEYQRNIMVALLNINNVLLKSFESRSLNDICEHLYKITNIYNNFYYQNRILTETDKDKRETWLTLTKIVYDNNCKMLDILGIEVPDRM